MHRLNQLIELLKYTISARLFHKSYKMQAFSKKQTDSKDLTGVIFIRNSDARYDNRLQKAIYAAIKAGNITYALSWIRDTANLPHSELTVADHFVGWHFLFYRADFGKGLGNLINLLVFNIWIVKRLFISRKAYATVYACDFDVLAPALLAKIILGKKVVYDIFDFYAHTHPLPSCITKIVESLEYLLLRYASKVIVCTEKRAQLLLDKTGVSSVVIFNTPNFELLTRRNQALTFTKNQHSSKSIIIAYVGTLSCSGRLLKEVVDLACQTQGYQLYIAGIGPLAEYIKLAASSFPNVKWYGHISYSEAMSLQEESDLLFATYDPSILINKYAAPNKVYEAMALSKPVIVCRESEPEELVARYACGSAINYSINQFQDVVKFYQQNRDFLNIHGSNGFDAYKRYFSWSISEKKLVSVFEQ